MTISPSRRAPRTAFSRFAVLASAFFLPPILNAHAQLAPPEEKPAVGARMPALSPDGKQLAFVWRGDVWVSAPTGGRAYRVTDHVELDAYPVFSPDGKWIAFSSVRNGNWDTFVVPSAGGAARQMTFSSGSEIATDWSPDGKTLLFTGQRDTPNTTIFALDVASLRFKKITEDFRSLGNPVFSPDGGRLVFQREGFPWTRPRYAGSSGAQLWTLDLASGKRDAVVSNGRQNLWPKWLPGGKSVVAVTTGEQTPNAEWKDKPLPRLEDSAARTPNLWAFPAGGGAGRQLTRFVGGSVRFPSVARQTGDVVFEHERDLYRLPAGGGTPQKLTLFCGAEDKQNNALRQTFTNSDVEEAEVSPDGKTFAFLLKGDLWTIPVDKEKNNRNAEDARRLTDYPGFDHGFNWSSDNKTIYFVSDRQGNDRIFALDVATRKVTPVWTGTEDASAPKVSPDGTMLGFRVAGPASNGERGGLYVKPTKGDGEARRVVAVPTLAQGDFSWSPDMKWIAYVKQNVESDGRNLYIAPADGTGMAINVTRLNANHGQPTWSPDGKYLFFTSNRDGDGLYVLPLQPEDARADELNIKYEKPKTPVTVAIDFTDIFTRIRKVSTQSVDGDLQIASDGRVFFVGGGDVYQSTFDGKEVKKITQTGGVSNLRVSADGNTLFFYKGGQLFTVKSASPPYPQTNVTFTAAWERDVRAERAAAFNQFWRTYNTRYYSRAFHGRDWAAIRARYEPLLDAVGTRDEFATLLNMMIGEVESSHSEVGAAPNPNPSPVTRNLGVYFDYSYTGPGIRVRDVPKRAPGSYAKTRIKPGEYIVAVDDRDVTLDENLYKVLNDKGDRDFVLLVNDKPTREGARKVTYRALSSGDWSDLHYQNRVERLRKEVERKSGGTLAYVHIAGMGLPNQTAFERELYEYAEGKKGVVIDVRFNGGGNIADQLITWLGLKPKGYYYPRDGYPKPMPGFGATRSWNKPLIVLMNQASASNAEMFPYEMRAHGLAKLVGVATPGYVIFTYGWSLVDGTSVRMPYSGVFREDGSPMENMGEKPDYYVPLTNEDWLAERDPQLEKAITLLMK